MLLLLVSIERLASNFQFIIISGVTPGTADDFNSSENYLQIVTTIPQFALEIPLNLRFNLPGRSTEIKEPTSTGIKEPNFDIKREHLISVINLISILVMF